MSKKKPGRPVTREERFEVKEMLEKGYKIAAISRVLNRPRDLIRRIRDEPIPPPKYAPQLPAQTLPSPIQKCEKCQAFLPPNQPCQKCGLLDLLESDEKWWDDLLGPIVIPHVPTFLELIQENLARQNQHLLLPSPLALSSETSSTAGPSSKPSTNSAPPPTENSSPTSLKTATPTSTKRSTRSAPSAGKRTRRSSSSKKT